MSSEPGPIAPLDPSEYLARLAEPWPDIAEDDLDAELSTLEQNLTEDEARLSEVSAEAAWLDISEAYNQAAEGILGDPLDVEDWEILGAQQSGPEVDDLVLACYDAVPPETWQPVPQPYQPPPDAPGWVATEDGELAPGVYPSPPGLPPRDTPYTGPPQVYLINLSRAGAADFRVGETWRVVVFGPHDEQVTVEAWQNQEARGVALMGYTDSLGQWWGEGSLAAEHVGDWVEQWRVGGLPCEPVLHFSVSW
jgi:hypothetical protein